MIETGGCLRFAFESAQRFAGIAVETEHAFDRDNATGMRLSRAIDHAHSTSPDLFQYVVIRQMPIGVADLDLTENAFQRLVALFSPQSRSEQTAQTQTMANGRSPSAF